MQSWPEAVVEHLCQSKQAGRTFEEGWALALRMHPPRSRDVPRALFDPDGGWLEESQIGALRRFCDDAWHGRSPKLGGFRVEMAMGVDGTRGAGQRSHRGHLRAAA